MLGKLDFFQPEEVVGVEFEIIEVLLSEAFAWSEAGLRS